jgi:Mg2+ and Co2+ transporter CorA
MKDIVERLRAENAALRHVINMAARTLAGEGTEDQGEAYDKCARILDAALGGEKKDEAFRRVKKLENDLMEALNALGQIVTMADRAIGCSPSEQDDYLASISDAARKVAMR